MKISIGTRTKDGPWGGGNLFAINLKNFLEDKGLTVINNLNHDDIDIILITEPRKTSESSAFTHQQVINYLKYVNNESLIVHRINECDERKNTNYINKYIIEANKVADYTIFVSTWLKNLYIEQGMQDKNKKVILSGSDTSIFNLDNYIPWDGQEKLSIVTHHWGANWNKGFEVYDYIDKLLDEEYWKDRIDFTYIGNLPEKFKFRNTKVQTPLSGEALAEKIKKGHVYITGSINEPSGNHHIEGALCGLPLMYLNSGGVPEYCKDFGLEYSIENLEIKLEEMMKDYKKYQKLLKNYPFKAEAMSKEYFDLFNSIIKNKEKLIMNREINLTSNRLLGTLYKKIKIKSS